MIYQNIKNMKSLDESIYLLSQNRKAQWLDIKSHTYSVAESLKPANMARQALADFKEDRNLVSMIKHGLSLGAGALVHQLAVRNTNNGFLKFAGRLLQISITNTVNRILKI